MKKIVATGLTIVLALSTMFIAAPLAYADDLIPTDTSLSSDIVAPSQENTLEEPAAPLDEPAVEPQSLEQIDPVSASDHEPTEDPALNISLTTSSVEFDSLSTTDLQSKDTLDGYLALVALGDALEDLYQTIKSAQGPSVIRIEEGLLNEENPSATFREGTYYTQIVALVNSINALLVELGLPAGVNIYTLPVSVVGELPEGFSFRNNTLTLTDMSLLEWNAELGDEPDATTRTYEIQLRLSTGIGFIDSWLSNRGTSGFVATTFTIELELSDPDGGGVPEPPDPIDPIDPTDPIDPPDPSNPGTNPDAGNQGGTGNTDGTVYGGLSATSTSTPATNEPNILSSENLDEGVSEGANEASEDSESSDSSAASSEEATIEDPLIPMATMMVDEDGNVNAVNVILVTLSLALSVVSLASIRQARPGRGTNVGDAPVQPRRSSMLFGITGAAFGAISVTLFIASQYLIAEPLNSNIAWSPLLIGIGVAQVICLVGLFASSRINSKKTKSRLNIRY